jgi:hypothetical protein
VCWICLFLEGIGFSGWWVWRSTRSHGSYRKEKQENCWCKPVIRGRRRAKSERASSLPPDDLVRIVPCPTRGCGLRGGKVYTVQKETIIGPAQTTSVFVRTPSKGVYHSNLRIVPKGQFWFFLLRINFPQKLSKGSTGFWGNLRSNSPWKRAILKIGMTLFLGSDSCSPCTHTHTNANHPHLVRNSVASANPNCIPAHENSI